jgi:integrase/recombinase XerD
VLKEMTMKRAAQPVLCQSGERALMCYQQRLRIEEDLSAVTIRNYLSGLRQFVVWCELTWLGGREESASFTSEAVTTPTLIDYRMYLQQTLHLKPTSVYRSLISLKCYFTWLVTSGQLSYDPTRVVKLVGEEVIPPRHLDDQAEQALVAAVTRAGNARDRAIIVLMLHTGLRAREVCTLTRDHICLGKRSGTIVVHGKRNKYRKIPLNATARAALQAYGPSLSKPQPYDTIPLFL